jgi:stage II sporulation protein D
VEIEEYLAGVVGREMGLRSPYEALKAQAIAARTYALFERVSGRVRGNGEPFDLYDDERSQVYGGADAESELSRRLVSETRGLVVTYQGRLVPAFFSSTCGGSTEPAWEVLPPAPRLAPLSGVACGHCSGSPFYSWKASFRKDELCEKLTGKKGRAGAVQVERAAPGGHALRIRFAVEGESSPRSVEANGGFRLKLDPRRLRSTRITRIRDLPDAVELSGQGWGHAAGLCQYGAMELARQGRSAFEILAFYYPGSSVERIH